MDELWDGTLRKGDVVRLVGLTQATHLNEKMGIVETDVLNEDGRFAVRLFPRRKKKAIGVKPSNLMKMPFNRDQFREEFYQKLEDWTHCENCSNDLMDHTMQECSNCLLVAYCCQACQRHHWKTSHKYFCDFFRQARKARAVPEALRQHPAVFADTLDKLCHRFQRKGDYPGMENLLRSSIKELHGVESFELRLSLPVLLVRSLWLQGKVDEGVDYMEEALRRNNRTTKSTDAKQRKAFMHREMGMALKLQGDLEGAIEHYKKAIELDSFPTPPLNEIGFLHYHLCNYEEAEKFFLRYLRMEDPFDDSNHPKAAIAAEVCHRLGLVMAIKADKECPLGDIPAESVEFIHKMNTEALGWFQMALHLDPTLKECEVMQKAIQIRQKRAEFFARAVAAQRDGYEFTVRIQHSSFAQEMSHEFNLLH